ncbi:hypothetical protein [Actinomadura sp. 6K520]|uniref:hypothetical protein n=1 Tax=Actinomadura sp. 6K520 TaxID=2530364 RepID=UPI001051BA0F|nr:hypothetical protein [Actinomadura sp. 6K520]TDE22962.1 hypothetical protein E1289_28990 [Actinomadura sp. 6K520]
MVVSPDDTVWYDAEIPAQRLRVGIPIMHEDVYATITKLIFDAHRRRVITETRGDDDRVMRVFEFGYDTEVTAAVITQYGIDRADRRGVMPVHTGHGARARDMALAYIAQRGGTLMTRSVIPDSTSETGALPAGEFMPAS